MVLRMGKPGALFIWAFVCLTAFFVCQTALQAASRTVYAFSRDKGLPDRGFFGHVSEWTQTPLRAIWLVTVVAILPGLLDLASAVALNAIFAMGLIGAGTNNARLAQMLRQLAGYYYKEPDCLFMVRIAQGLVNMGKGTITINPFFHDRQIMSRTAVASLLSVLLAFTDAKGCTCRCLRAVELS